MNVKPIPREYRQSQDLLTKGFQTHVGLLLIFGLSWWVNGPDPIRLFVVCMSALKIVRHALVWLYEGNDSEDPVRDERVRHAQLQSQAYGFFALIVALLAYLTWTANWSLEPRWAVATSIVLGLTVQTATEVGKRLWM